MARSGSPPPPREKEQAVDISLWTEAKRWEILCNVTMSTSGCISATGIINLIMVVEKKNT